MECYKYKNFINKDPILDWFNYKRLVGDITYIKDNEFENFDKELLLETYTSKYKKTFCEEIKKSLSSCVVWLQPDVFLMKNKDIKKYFKNYNQEADKEKYSLFTIEYTTLKVLKDNVISSSHYWYNFKNWFFTKSFMKTYAITSSYIIGRKYKGQVISNRFNNLALNIYDYSQVVLDGDKHLQTLHLQTFEPNFNNKQDYPWHHSKKLYKKNNDSKTKENFYFNNGLYLDLPEISSKNVYVDFELLTSVYDDFVNFPESNDKVYLFNIGLYQDNNFTSFHINELHEEKKMIEKFASYLNEIRHDFLILFHWTNVEKRIFEQKLKEYSHIHINKQILWFDLHDYFIKSKISIGGCNDRKLKNVCRVLYENGMIQSKWENGLIFDGLGSMTGYLKYLKTKSPNIINSIVNYNMIDCKVLYEIHDFLLKVPDT